MRSVREEAARWFARIQNMPLDHPDRGPFETWLAAHPAHATEYAAFAALWDDFDSTARLDALGRAMEKRAADARKAEESRRASRRRLLKGSALGLLLSGGAGALAWRTFSEWYAQPLLQLALSTRVAQSARQALADGSHIALGPDSAVAVAFYRDRREVRLDRGEAIFDVARDPERPFTVDGGVARVTVLGTRFAVARLGDRLRVSVASGRVLVTGPQQGEEAAIELNSGEVAEASSQAAPSRIDRRAADGFAWERGTLIFDGATLAEIAESLSRYRTVPVRAVAGTAPRITAVVQVADIEGFLRNLPVIAPVRVESTPEGTRLAPR